MLHRTRPMTAPLVLTRLNVVLVSTITPFYDFVSFHPYGDRSVRMLLTLFYYPDLRERHRQEREAALANNSKSI